MFFWCPWCPWCSVLNFHEDFHVEEVAMRTHDTRLVDSQSFARCEVCLDYLPIEYYFTSGDTIVCRECETEYTLVSVHPVKLTMNSQGYHDSFIREMHFDE